jgi:hypothetical protein
MDKKEQEKKSLNKVKNFYKNFPIGEIDDSESPDFIIRGNKKRIGIEIIRLFKDKTEQELNTLARENSQDFIVAEAKKICETRKIKPLKVDISFNSYPDIFKVNKKESAFQLAHSIIDNIPSNKKHISVKNKFDGTIPEIINSFFILHSSTMNKHQWLVLRAGRVSTDFISEIQRVINKKNKYNIYLTKCDECWLVIDAPGNSPSSFFDPVDETINYAYKSKFNKTFFVGGFIQRFIELNTTKY